MSFPCRRTLPFDLLREIAFMIYDDDASYFVSSTTLRSCSLVNQLFAAAFQPYLFRTFVIGDSARLALMQCPPRIPRLLEIFSSRPHLAQHVKHLILIMHYSGNSSGLSLVLDCFSNLRTLTVKSRGPSEIDGLRPFWTSFSQAFRDSVHRLCSLGTLNNLQIVEVDSMPASLFLSQAHLTDVAFSRCKPLFERSHLVNPIPESSSPLSLEIPGTMLEGVRPLDISTSYRGFFSRLRCLKIIATGGVGVSQGLDLKPLIFSLATVCQLDRLHISLSCESSFQLYPA
jgi:hypothetical protein